MTTRKMKDRAGVAIQRFWGDVPVVDAEDNLRVHIAPEDVARAVRRDGANCVLAQAVKRQFGSEKALFFRKVAYVQLPKEDGVPRVERFLVPPAVRALVEAFDRGEQVIPKAGFVLRAPPIGWRLNDELRKQQKRTQRERQMVVGKAERLGNQGVGRYRDKPITVDLSVRSGTGAVHFTMKKLAPPPPAAA